MTAEALQRQIDRLARAMEEEKTRERPQLIEYHVPAYRTQQGSTPPTNANRAVGASGNVLLPVTQFASNQQNDVYLVFHAPKELRANIDVQFHVMWIPGTGWSSGNYMLKLEYLVMTESQRYNIGTPTTISMNVTPANNLDFIETEFTDDITVAVDQMIICHFYRDVANDNGNGTLDVLFFEFEYWVR